MKSNIIEGILICVAVTLIIFLIWNQGNYMNKKTILENEYEYNAIKFTNTENTITATRYMVTGNPIKYVETLYIENGKITKIIEEEYYKSIDSAKQSYNWTVNNSSMESAKVSIRKNVIIYTNNNPEVSLDKLEEVNFSTNQDFIKYAEDHIGETYPGFVRVY